MTSRSVEALSGERSLLRQRRARVARRCYPEHARGMIVFLTEQVKAANERECRASMQLKIPKIETASASLSAKTLEIHANLVLLVPATKATLASLPHGQTLAQRMERAHYKRSDARPFVTELPNSASTRIAIGGVRSDHDTFSLLTLARELIAAHAAHRPARLAIAAHGLSQPDAHRGIEAVLAAALAACFQLPEYKSRPNEAWALKQIVLFGYKDQATIARIAAEAKGNNLARYLTALPANELTPKTYRKRAEQLARAYGWKSEFLDLKKLRSRGAGAFIAVAQGSPDDDAGILHLHYEPTKKGKRKPVALVGKGICFDTGGTNLKPARYMHGMHEDMEGSAVALGSLLALTELKVDFPIDCWLALAQNHIGPKAYKQNEVVKAANGTTIEIVHTDAEGRMVLADTLFFASKQKPALIIDYATLTGACVAALSTRASGVFTNRTDWTAMLIKAGEASGERVWPFPTPPDYEEALKSDVADIKQCTLENDADHILAALFLKRFVAADVPWLHIDLSAGNHKGGLAHIPTNVTGFGVRLSLNLLLDQKAIKETREAN